MIDLMSQTYALILAGGSGTRFWPLSRDAKPKQLLNLLGDTTLLNQTISRLKGLIPTENILILTNQLQIDAVREVASELPAENIFAEPAKRDTAPAVALGVGLVAARDPKATMVILPADQLISDIENFHGVMSDAIATAQQTEALVTIGIKPTWPCPSFGYVERGAASPIAPQGLNNVPHEVTRFREKPAPELAEKFLAQGNFAWNAGMFIWSVPTVIKELSKHTPELAEFIDALKVSADIVATVDEKFAQLTPISIDYALMENASQVLNIEANFDWDDVGSWISVSKYLDAAENDNRTNSPLVEIDSSHNIVFTESKKTQVALLGVHDLIVVQTVDSLLVAHRDKADDIKKIVSKLPKELT